MTEEKWTRPIATIDIVLMTIIENKLAVATTRRNEDPFKDRKALFGGWIHTDEDEDLDAAAIRILKTKFGKNDFFLEQLKTFSGRTRDPRGWSLSVAYYSLLPEGTLEPSHSIELTPIENVKDLAFDHDVIVMSAVDRIRGKGGYSTIPAHLLPDSFTLNDLQRVYEIATGRKIDTSSFRRKVKELNMLKEISGSVHQTSIARRPAQLYELNKEIVTFDRRI